MELLSVAITGALSDEDILPEEDPEDEDFDDLPPEDDLDGACAVCLYS